MKYLYLSFMIVSIFILCYCVVKSYQAKKSLAKKLGNLLFAATFSIFANIGLILAETEQTSNLAYVFFFISFDIMIYTLLIFILEYTGHHFKRNSLWNTLRIILGVDIISFLLHLKYAHAFGIQRFELTDGTPYFHVTYRLPYVTHLAISYALLIVAFGLLIHKSVKSPDIYRKKYLIVIMILLALILMNALFVFTNQPFDVSMILFAIGGILIYYYALIYIPKDLLDDTLSMVVDKMNDSVVLFEIDGSCVYYNKKAASFLKLDSLPQKEKKQFLQRLTGNQMLSMCQDFCHECEEIIDGETVYLRIFFHRLTDNKNQYLGSYLIIHDRTPDVAQLQQEHYDATHDALTGLYNKDFFFENVQKQLENEPYERFFMLCADIKHFKMINILFGPSHSDNLLIRIANELKSKTHPGEIYGRLDNDHFAILMKKKDFREHKFLEILREEFRIEKDYSFPIHIQIGIYEITNPNIPVTVMCDRALLAIHKIKDDYHKKLAYYDDSLRYRTLSEHKLTEDALVAMETGQMQIYLHPLVNSSGTVVGAESLTRWFHPERGLIMPEEFLPIFEKNSLIVSLDQYVWRLACQQLQKWKLAGREDLSISINISPTDFFYIDVCKTLCNLLKEYDVSIKNLKLEIAESALLMDLNKQLPVLEKLHKSGFTIEMDDFGSGYSSFHLLKNIAIDVLKIDITFLKEERTQERSWKILKMIIDLAKELNLTVITEGIETEEQLTRLKELGSDFFQGFHIAIPMSIREFEKKYL